MKDFLQFKEAFTKNLLSKKPSTQLRKWQKQGLLKKYLPPLDKCATIRQDLKFHKDTVFEHCVKTCDNTPKDLVMRWAGLLHDIGKSTSYGEHILCELDAPKKVVRNSCPISGKRCNKKCKHAILRITFYKHEIESDIIAKKVLKKYKVPEEDKRQILELIRMHMYNYTFDWTDKAVRRFISKSGITLTDLQDPDEFPLFRLRIADRISRGIEPVTQRQRDFEARLINYLYEQ